MTGSNSGSIPEGDRGPWVDIIPTKMLVSLASLAALEVDELQAIAGRWSQTEELAHRGGWPGLATFR
jgi:hypothetical protein